MEKKIKLSLCYEFKSGYDVVEWFLIPRIDERIIHAGSIYRVAEITHCMETERIIILLKPSI